MKADTDLSDLAMCMGRSTRTWLSQRMASQAYKRSLRNEGGCSMKWALAAQFQKSSYARAAICQPRGQLI
jgi:hypothetical protein